MSHYAVIVLIEAERTAPRDVIESLVGEALKPHEERHWDWFQIGGRWTGHFTGYEPSKDPLNIETCSICNGTGERPNGLAEFGQEWFDRCHGCNGCRGEGTKAKWPTEWVDHDGDVKPVDVLNDGDLQVHAICDSERGWMGGEEYLPWKPVGEMFPKREMPPLEWLQKEYPNHMAVIVDCHN